MSLVTPCYGHRHVIVKSSSRRHRHVIGTTCHRHVIGTVLPYYSHISLMSGLYCYILCFCYLYVQSVHLFVICYHLQNVDLVGALWQCTDCIYVRDFITVHRWYFAESLLWVWHYLMPLFSTFFTPFWDMKKVWKMDKSQKVTLHSGNPLV